jgi:hypothetical protein
MGLSRTGFVLRTQAAGAQVEMSGFAGNVNSGGVDIGCPAPVGVALGVTHVMTEKRGFTAQIALQFPLSP